MNTQGYPAAAMLGLFNLDFCNHYLDTEITQV